MARFRRRLIFAVALASVTGITVSHAQQMSVRLIHSVNLPGYEGDFDHFAVDYDRNRLSARSGGPRHVEVFDLKTSAHLSHGQRFRQPSSILVRKGVPTVFITDSTKLNATIRDATTYDKKKTVDSDAGIRHGQV